MALPAHDLEIGPIVRDSTPVIIATRLREAIATGRFGPGEQLGEAALAKTFGVSRGPLREAMQRLTQEGLLISHRNRGLFVLDLGPDDIRDVYFAREALERAAVERIIGNGQGAAAAAELGAILDVESAPDQWATKDMRYHVALVRLCGSPRLRSMHATLITQIRMCLTRMEHGLGDPGDLEREHRELTAAIAHGDLAGAVTMLREHMRDGLGRVLADARA